VTDVLELHRHSTVGFALPVPVGWERTEDVDGCALVAVEPPRKEPHLRASVVVTVEELDAEPEAWIDRSLAAVQDSLVRYRLIDDEPVELGGHPARRVLGHYVHGQFGGVNLEQCLVAHAGLGYVISCTVAALEYDDLWDLMQSVAVGFRPA
jgi:hypothetical protein